MPNSRWRAYLNTKNIVKPTINGALGVGEVGNADRIWARTPQNLASKGKAFTLLIIGDRAVCQSAIGPGEASALFLTNFNNLCLIYLNT